MRFLCVSKIWSSIISTSRDFIESIVTRSLTQPPRDAYFIYGHTSHSYMECFLAFSSTCPRNIDKESILIPERLSHYVRGLIFCWSDSHHEGAIYNPTTRQSFHLPKNMHMGTCFFGYDPLKNQYKVLFIPIYSMRNSYQVFTLRDPTGEQWRNIQGVGSHIPLKGAVCINGAIYYQAENTISNSTSRYKLISFDVRSEIFYHVDAPKTLMGHCSSLINYKGKLGFVCCEQGIEIWVMETQGWSKIFFDEMDGFFKKRILGATRGGEIAFVKWGYLSYDNLCILYYDPKLKSKRCVDLEEFYPKDKRRNNRILIWTIPDYVENTMCLYQLRI